MLGKKHIAVALQVCELSKSLIIFDKNYCQLALAKRETPLETPSAFATQQIELSKTFHLFTISKMAEKKKQKFITLTEYLYNKGVTEDTPESEIQQLKKDHKKEYQEWYREQRKRNDTPVQIRLNVDDLKKFKRLMKEERPDAQKGLSTFIKDAALGYLRREVISNENEDLKDVKRKLAGVATNLNQLATRANREGRIGSHKVLQTHLVKISDVVDTLVFKINNPEKVVVREELTPKVVFDFLRDYLSNNPEDVHHFQTLLDSFSQQQNT